MQKLRETPCDVLLLDLSLPGQSGVDVLRAVRQRYESLKVLVLSGFPEERYALPMIRNGKRPWPGVKPDQVQRLRIELHARREAIDAIDQALSTDAVLKPEGV